MSTQKNIKISSKKKNSKNSLKEDIVLSSKDASILEDSINLVMNLSKEVGFVETAKNKLQKDLSNLLKKVEEHEKKHLDVLADKTFINLKKEVTNQVEVLSIALSEQTKKQSNLQSSILKIKKELTNDLKNHQVNFTSLESHIKKLNKDFSGLKSLVGRFEDDLFNKKSEESSILEKNLKQEISIFSSKLEEIKLEKDSENLILVEKLNEFVDIYERLNVKIQNIDKKVLKNQELQIKKEIESLEKSLELNVNKIFEKLQSDFKEDLKNFKQEEHSFINLRLDSIALEISNFEKKLSKLELEGLKKLDSRILKIEENLEKIIDKRENNNLNLFNRKFLELEKVINEVEKQILVSKKQIDEKLLKQNKINENYVKKEIDLLKKEFLNLDKSKQKEQKEIISRLDSLMDLYSEFEKKFKNFRKDDFEKLSFSLKEDVKKFETLLLQDFTIAFDDLKKNFDLEVSNKLNKISEEFKVLKDDHKDFENDRKEEHNFIQSQFNNLLEQVSNFENKLEEIEIKGLDSISKKLTLVEEKNKEDFEKKYNKFILEVNDSIALLQSKNIEDQQKNKKEFENFKLELASLSKHFTKELDIELNDLKTLTKEFHKEKSSLKSEVENKINSEILRVEGKLIKLEEIKKSEERFIENKLNEVIDSFNELSLEQQKSFISLRDDSGSLINSKAKNLEKNINELFSKEKLNLSENLSTLKVKIKDFQQEISSHLEVKFEKSNSIFRNEFDSFLNSFNQELKLKEEEFLQKLNIIEKDKQEMLVDLNEFKQNIAKLTQDFSFSLHEKLDNLEQDKLQFEQKEQRVIDHIDSIVAVNIEKINSKAEEINSNLPKILEENKLKIENSDNSFRNLFNEKFFNLNSQIENKLNLIEKNFIDKNLSEIEIKADNKISLLNNLNKELDAKQEVINDYISDFDLKLRTFQENFTAKEQIFQNKVDDEFKKLLEKENLFEKTLTENLDAYKKSSELHKDELVKELQEKVELRLTNQEKQLNKQFLDLDSEFSNFKKIVVDEVEDTLKEITDFVNQKTSHVDKTLDKLNFVLVESSKRLKELENVDNHINSEIQTVRDDVNDLRVKFEIIGHPHSNHDSSSINSLVTNMSEYEGQLIGLIETLKNKGFSDSQIKDALVQKGHPKIYVSMILSYYDEE